MTSKYKKIKALIEHRFDRIEADIKAIKMAQSNINRRLESLEEKLDYPNYPHTISSHTERELND